QRAGDRPRVRAIGAPPAGVRSGRADQAATAARRSDHSADRTNSGTGIATRTSWLRPFRAGTEHPGVRTAVVEAGRFQGASHSRALRHLAGSLLPAAERAGGRTSGNAG